MASGSEAAASLEQGRGDVGGRGSGAVDGKFRGSAAHGSSVLDGGVILIGGRASVVRGCLAIREQLCSVLLSMELTLLASLVIAIMIVERAHAWFGRGGDGGGLDTLLFVEQRISPPPLYSDEEFVRRSLRLVCISRIP